MLYKNLPRNVGLKRLTLHKSATGPNVNYILLVECSHFLDNINQVISSATIGNHVDILHLTGGQPTASAASEDMRLYRNFPHSRVLLTLSTWVRDTSPHHPTDPRPQPRTLPTVASVRTPLGSRALVRHQEV